MQYRSQAKDSNKESGKKLLQETETQELQKTNQAKNHTINFNSFSNLFFGKV